MMNPNIMDMPMPPEIMQELLGSTQNFDSWIESLYEDKIEEKCQGAKSILMMCQKPIMMNAMLKHESFLGVVSRTLRDEGKKSLELTIYLLGIMYAFSNYHEFHMCLIENKIGNTCLKLLDYQIRRAELLKQDSAKKAESSSTKQGSLSKQEESLEQKKQQSIARKQDKVFLLCVQILLNLSVEYLIQKKMVKLKLVSYLVKLLDRNNIFLVIATLSFLKNLSIINENKDEMKVCHVDLKLKRFLQINHPFTKTITLKLIYNLSFDKEFRAQLDKNGYLNIFVELLKQSSFRLLTIKILYLLSQDEKIRSTFSYTDAIPIIYQLLINFPEKIVAKELVSLAINLMCNSRNAEQMSSKEQMEALIKRSLKNHDYLVFKVVKNISQFATGEVQEILDLYTPDLIKFLLKTDDPELQTEILGALVYTYTDKWNDHIKSTGILQFIESNLQDSDQENNELALGVIMAIGTICASNECATQIASTQIVQYLAEIVGSPLDQDEEILLQVVYAFHKMLIYKPTRDLIINSIEISTQLMALLDIKNDVIQKELNNVMDIFQLYKPELTEQIKKRKFTNYNQAYLNIVESEDQRFADNAMIGEDFDDGDNINDIQIYDCNDLQNRVWNGSDIPLQYIQ